MAESIITSVIPKVSAGGIINGILIGLICLIALTIIGYFVWWYIKKKKYNQYKIVIWEKDSNGNVHETFDRAGVFLDKKTQYKLLFLEKLKKGLRADSIPYISSKDKKGRLVKTVYMRKIGVSNYVFCDMKMNDLGVEFTVGEEDVNWAAQDIQTIKRQFNKDSWMTKFAPYIMFIITIMIVMIVVISLFNKFTILKEVSSNMVQITEGQERITSLMYNITGQPALNPGSPVIITGGGGK